MHLSLRRPEGAVTVVNEPLLPNCLNEITASVARLLRSVACTSTVFTRQTGSAGRSQVAVATGSVSFCGGAMSVISVTPRDIHQRLSRRAAN